VHDFYAVCCAQVSDCIMHVSSSVVCSCSDGSEHAVLCGLGIITEPESLRPTYSVFDISLYFDQSSVSTFSSPMSPIALKDTLPLIYRSLLPPVTFNFPGSKAVC